VANLGYVQLTRACNQLCRFCSNPPTGLELGLADACRHVDDLRARGYDGVILTGGEPTLVAWLPEAVRYAAEHGIAPRIITNGQRLAEGPLLDALVAAGLRHVHCSLYSADPAVHDALTRAAGALGGWDRPSKFLKNMTFGSYNDRFAPVKTQYDWLSRDETRVKAYVEDPLCGFACTPSLFYDVVEL
jgi:pyruvate-formate lyase-activating enzyme